jgi:hypothetical protein
MAAAFISERRPTSNRNGGRLRVGIPGRNKSESATKSDTANRREDLSDADNPMIAEMAVTTASDISYEISTWLPAANADVRSPLPYHPSKNLLRRRILM